MAGYIRLYRTLLDHPAFAHAEVFRLWTFCLMRANWQAAETMIPGTLTPITVRRGQFITGRDKIHCQMFGQKHQGKSIPTARSVWRWMTALEKLGCINLENLSNRCTLVTVCNYSTYQTDADEDSPTGVQPASNRRPTDGATNRRTGVQPIGGPVSTIEEGKEGKEVNKGKKGRKKASLVSLEECLLSVESVNPAIADTWRKWMEYRSQKGLSFVPIGLTAAVSEVNNAVSDHGANVVIAAITKAMGAGHKGWYVNNGSNNNSPKQPEPERPRATPPPNPKTKPVNWFDGSASTKP